LERKVTSHENLNNSKIFGEGSYQTSLENLNNHRITKESFQISLVNSIPVNWRREVTKSYYDILFKGVEGKELLNLLKRIIPEDWNVHGK